MSLVCPIFSLSMTVELRQLKQFLSFQTTSGSTAYSLSIGYNSQYSIHTILQICRMCIRYRSVAGILEQVIID